MKLGIYGGTFAPVHNAHVRAAEAFISECRLDKLLIIPAGIPPHKAVAADDDPNKRLEMCRLAFSHIRRAEVSDMELRRSGRSYTVLTVRELENEDTELYLLCGTDMILTFDQWFCFREIMEKCTLVYIRRENDAGTGVMLDEKIDEYRNKYGARIIKLDLPALEMSSTMVRDIIKNGGDASSLVPESVMQYIDQCKMYRKENETDE